MAFNSILSEFFDDAILNPNDEEDMDLLKFRENRNYNASLFMRTISFDFKIIKDLNKGMAEELKTEYPVPSAFKAYTQQLLSH